MATAKCSECGAEVSDPQGSCPVCSAPLRADASADVAMAQRILKGDNLRAFGMGVGVLGIVVLLSEGSETLGMVSLGLAVVVYIIGSALA